MSKSISLHTTCMFRCDMPTNFTRDTDKKEIHGSGWQTSNTIGPWPPWALAVHVPPEPAWSKKNNVELLCKPVAFLASIPKMFLPNNTNQEIPRTKDKRRRPGKALDLEMSHLQDLWSQVRKLWQTKIPCCQGNFSKFGSKNICMTRNQHSSWAAMAAGSCESFYGSVSCRRCMRCAGKIRQQFSSKEWGSPFLVIWLMMFPRCSIFSGNCRIQTIERKNQRERKRDRALDGFCGLSNSNLQKVQYRGIVHLSYKNHVYLMPLVVAKFPVVRISTYFHHGSQ